MNKVPLHFMSITQIAGVEKMGLLILVDEEERRQLAIPCDEAMLHQVMLRKSHAAERNLMLPEVLWQVLSSQTDMRFEILINDLIDEQYRAILYNIETLEPVAIRASDAVLLSYIGKIPLFIEERLMMKQSVPYYRETKNVYMPINVVSNNMLKEALDKAVKDENYELASHLRDEMLRRKLK